MKTVLPQLELKESNPSARFFSGVIRITQRDYESVVAAGTGKAPPAPVQPAPGTGTPAPSPPSVPVVPPADGGPVDVGLLFKTAEKLTKVGKLAGSLSEYDTRAEFIDKSSRPSDTRSWVTSSAAHRLSRATSPTTCCA